MCTLASSEGECKRDRGSLRMPLPLPRCLCQPRKGLQRSVQLSEAALDCDLPDNNGTYYHLIPAGDRLSRFLAKSVWFSGHPPEDDMGIEQERQGSMPMESARSSGSSSKSSAIRTRPCQAPAGLAKGTTRFCSLYRVIDRHPKRLKCSKISRGRRGLEFEGFLPSPPPSSREKYS
jgi:hypothetical protein